eukprot:1713656-Prymnesium_polylepis.1
MASVRQRVARGGRAWHLYVDGLRATAGRVKGVSSVRRRDARGSRVCHLSAGEVRSAAGRGS